MVISACSLRGTPQPSGKTLSSERYSSTRSSVEPSPPNPLSVDVLSNTPATPVSTTSNPSSTSLLKPQRCFAGVSATLSGCLTEKPFLGDTKVSDKGGKSTTAGSFFSVSSAGRIGAASLDRER